MKIFDFVELIREDADLERRNIHKGYHGLIVAKKGSDYCVSFMNPKNYGESVYATVKKEYIKYASTLPKNLHEGNKNYLKTVDIYSDKTCLTECDVKEYDKVEIIVEKEEYAKEGVHKDMTGCVWQPYAIDGKWSVFFDLGVDRPSVEISVDRKDFKIVED